MSKGKWAKTICQCGKCRKCKDRERQQKIRDGTFVPRKILGRAAERKAAEKREYKKQWKAIMELKKKQKMLDKEKARVARDRRSCAYKHNKERYGEKRAKFIAVYMKDKVTERPKRPQKAATADCSE